MIDDSILLANESTEDAPATASTPLICASQGIPPCRCSGVMHRTKKREEESTHKEGHGLFLLEPPCPLFGRYREKVDIDFTKCKIGKEDRANINREFRNICTDRRLSREKGDEKDTEVPRKLSPPPLLSSKSSGIQYVECMRDIRMKTPPSISPSPPPAASPSSHTNEPVDAEIGGNSIRGLQARWKKSFDEIRKIKPGEQEDTFIKNYDTLAKVIDDFSEKAKLYAQVIITEVKFKTHHYIIIFITP